MSVLYNRHGKCVLPQASSQLNSASERPDFMYRFFFSVRFHLLSLPSSFLRAFPKHDDAAQ